MLSGELFERPSLRIRLLAAQNSNFSFVLGVVPHFRQVIRDVVATSLELFTQFADKDATGTAYSPAQWDT